VFGGCSSIIVLGCCRLGDTQCLVPAPALLCWGVAAIQGLSSNGMWGQGIGQQHWLLVFQAWCCLDPTLEPTFNACWRFFWCGLHLHKVGMCAPGCLLLMVYVCMVHSHVLV
jgi:hypothetical protein